MVATFLVWDIWTESGSWQVRSTSLYWVWGIPPNEVQEKSPW